MRKFILLIALFGVFAMTITHGQVPIPTFLSQTGVDFNHYSIEQSPLDDTYVIAGTLFHPSGDTEIHLLKIDFNGILMWEVTSNAGLDDRALDVVVDPNGDIIVVGYTDAISANQNIYMGKWDMGGGFINDMVININNAGPTFPCAATNIIYSPSTGQYIVGGFWAENFNYPLVAHNYSILFSVDLGLTTVNWVNHFTSTVSETNSSINDILETSTGRIFATGSVGLTGGSESQGVLALIVNPGSGNVIQNLSFESTNSEHVGVSATYDDVSDEIWLMSNNSVVHNPQINLISDVSSAPFLNPAVSYYLELDQTYGSYNAAGFTLLPHYDHPHDVLVAVGYYRTSGPSGNDATLWYIEFERYSGASFSPVHEWMAPSNNFHTHGGGLFSTFSGEHPYIFNQEILVDNLSPSSNTSRYVAIAPSDHTGNYGIEILPMPGYSSCIDEYKRVPKTISFVPINVLDFISPPNFITNMGVSSATSSPQKKWCYIKPKSKNESLVVHESDQVADISLSPNPAGKSVIVDISGISDQGILKIWDVAGHLMETVSLNGNSQKNIHLGGYNPGVYIIQYQDEEHSVFRKLTKK